MNSNKKPVVLVIFDGLGHSLTMQGNAVAAAHMTFFENLQRRFPSLHLAASGEAVGLPSNFIGNSQVGHLTLGAGRIIKSSLVQFHELITSGALKTHHAAKLLCDFSRKGNKLHIIGLLSDGGVHSHEFHLHSLLELAVSSGIKNIYIHPILDGRDVDPQSAAIYLDRLELKIKSLGVGKIASLQGRFYAMDRDNNWDRTRCSFSMLQGEFGASACSWQDVLAYSYADHNNDEFVKPVLLDVNGNFSVGDAVVFANFRPDRARQLTACFLGKDVEAKALNFDFVLTGSRYDKRFVNPVILDQEPIFDTFLDVVESFNPSKKIFLIAETEKYAHVTYFFKGMRDDVSPSEEGVMIPSLKVRDYVKFPQMSAKKITATVKQALALNEDVLCVVNYANADMVGHSGDFQATVLACQELDAQLEELYNIVVQGRGGDLFITADHGNAESMIDLQGLMRTSHTTNKVPFIMIAQDLEGSSFELSGSNEFLGIAHVAPTILKRMGIAAPLKMTKSLF